MVAPSAWASHILVDSKSEAIQIKQKISKLKNFRNLQERKALAHPHKKGGDLGWFRKGMMVENLMRLFGAYHCLQPLNQLNHNSVII